MPNSLTDRARAIRARHRKARETLAPKQRDYQDGGMYILQLCSECHCNSVLSAYWSASCINPRCGYNHNLSRERNQELYPGRFRT